MAQTKQQKEIIALVGLIAVAVLIWYSFFSKKIRTDALFPSGTYTTINVEDYSRQIKDLESTRETEYKSAGRNIFVAAPPPAPPSAPAEPVKPPYVPAGPRLPPPPPAPELGMKFFGLGTLPASGPRRAFLQDGDDVRIVGEGDTVKNHIRITHIGNDRIEYEDINTGMKNSTILEMPPPV
jgi:hypothetical protein